MQQLPIPEKSPPSTSEDLSALIISAYPNAVLPLSDFLRDNGVAVYTENDVDAGTDYEYGFFIGSWKWVLQITDSQLSRVRKGLVIVVDSIPAPREVSDFLSKNKSLKLVFTFEQDVPHINYQEVLSFFFSRSPNKVYTLSAIHNDFSKETHKNSKKTILEDVEKPVSRSPVDNFFFEKDKLLPSSHVGFSSPQNSLRQRFFFYLPQKMRMFASVVLIFLLLFGAIVVYPVGSTLAHLGFGLWSMRTLSTDIQSGNYQNSEKTLLSALSSFEKGINGLVSKEWLIPHSLFPLFSFGLRATGVARESLLGVKAGFEAATLAQKSASLFLNSGGGELARVLGSMQESLTLAQMHFSIAEADSKSFLSYYPRLFEHVVPKSKAEDYLSRLWSVRQTTGFFSNFLSLVPPVIGFSGKKTYLIVFQNNMELRPTGGFIGSYGLVSFDQGKMGELHVEDIYTADGQLKGHVEPPFAIKTFLGQEHWYMRDSNWDPDFSVSGERLAWFLEKETGTVVDGVVSLDLYAAASLLRVLGPIDLVDYHEKVSADTLFEKAQLHAQSDFFPGSTQKRDFLGSLSRSIITALSSQTSPLLGPALMQELQGAFTQKHILVYLRDSKLEAVVQKLGIGGVLTQEQCVTVSCFSDFFYVVDSNLGVNKANAFVQKAVTVGTAFATDGSVTHHVSLLYQNHSPQGQTFPGGDYRNYLRVLVPLGATVSNVFLDKESVSYKQKATYTYKGGDQVYFTDQDEGRGMIEVFFEVPAGSERTLQIDYRVPGQLAFSAGSGATYTLTIPKQPGTNDDYLYTTVSYPSFWQLTHTVKNGGVVAGATTLAKDGQLRYNGRLLHDAQMKLQFIH